MLEEDILSPRVRRVALELAWAALAGLALAGLACVSALVAAAVFGF